MPLQSPARTKTAPEGRTEMRQLPTRLPDRAPHRGATALESLIKDATACKLHHNERLLPVLTACFDTSWNAHRSFGRHLRLHERVHQSIE